MEPRYGRPHPGLVPGIVLVVIGAIFFLNNLHIIYVHEWLRFWPAILIAFGIVKLVDSNETGGRVGGGILIGVGVIFLGETLGYLNGLSLSDLWPLILIGLGVLMLFQRTFPRPGTLRGGENPAGTINESAVFGGGKRNIVTEDFRGGKISAVFAGFEVDLRRASMAEDSAVLHVDVVFGGVEIKIPQNWSAEVRGTGVFGAYVDETMQPSPNTPGVKRLIVKGGAVFGGVAVKN